MAATAIADKFANLASVDVVESAANTLTFKKLEMGFSQFDKLAMILHRIEYYFFYSSAILNGGGDSATAALTVSGNLTSLVSAGAYKDPAIVDVIQVIREDLGVAASGWFDHLPIRTSFTDFPSGGLIIPPNPLFLGVMGSGAAGPLSCAARLYFTIMKLDPSDYWELVESRRVISS